MAKNVGDERAGFVYTNRRGVAYRLLRGRTPKGNDKFYMAKGRKAQGEPVDEVPAGYELREDPASGTVSVRRVRGVATTEDERAVVEAAVVARGDLFHFVVDAEEDRLGVFVTRYDLFPDELERPDPTVGEGVAARGAHAEDRLCEALRFVLVDAETRTFCAERPHGTGDDTHWHRGPTGPLATLAEKWIPTIGEAELFDSW